MKKFVTDIITKIWYGKNYFPKEIGNTRITIIDGRYYPQLNIDGYWTTILSNTWDGKWYIPPTGFTGFEGRRNAEITLELCYNLVMTEKRNRKLNKIYGKLKHKT